MAEHYGFRTDVPVRDLSEEARRILLYGNSGERVAVRYRARNGNVHTFKTTFEGVDPEPDAALPRDRLRRDAGGDRAVHDQRAVPDLRRHAAQAGVAGGDDRRAEHHRDDAPLGDRCAGLVRRACPTRLNERENQIARQVLKEIRARLGFLVDVGLDYLTLDRASGTLSGGEAQRIRLATQIGSSLMGVLYILDEPSIGLHQRDNDRLIATLVRLRDLGNTLLVVEHDEETIRAADWVIDIGPGGGRARRPAHPLGPAGRAAGEPSVRHGGLPARRQVGPDPEAAAQRQGRGDRRARRAGEQPQGDRRRLPARSLRGRHRRERVREVEPGDADPPPRPRPAHLGRARAAPGSTTGSRGSSGSTR